jgi:DNA helicase-2/ATP-dependent DNA helicase PcrA
LLVESFEKAYASLNAAQKKAVDTIDGPVLVIAGPGTGKTQLISTRIGHILKVTDTLPGAADARGYSGRGG